MKAVARAAVTLVLVGLAGCGGSAPATSSPGVTSPAAADTFGFGVEQTIQATEVPTPTDDPLTGPVGTTFVETDTDNNSFRITLTGVVDPARPTGEFAEAPVAGTHYVVLHFTAVGVTGIISHDDVAAEAALIGSDGHTYQQAGGDAATCVSNLNSGVSAYEFSLTPGASATPCAVYDVLNGVQVGRVTWGVGVGAVATWTVNG